MNIKFGPAGLGPVNSAVSNLKEYNVIGLKACEIAFTYGVYIKENQTLPIKQAAEKYNIDLTIHAPYYINLNSQEKIKLKLSKLRILECCKIGNKLGVKTVVFHPGFYNKLSPQASFENIKNSILDLKDTIKDNSYDLNIAPEIMGKVNVFGSIEEIIQLVNATKCSLCIDFAHVLARYKDNKFSLINEQFSQFKKWHTHFSGIEYSEKGEKRHIKTTKENWQNLLKNLPKDKEITIINESPDMINDSLEGLNLSKNIF